MGSINNVGGIAGRSFGTIENCYMKGSVTGNNRVGGLVGSNNSGTIKNSYATGDVSGSSKGGLVEGNSGTCTNSYWNTDTGISTSGCGTPSTTSELQSPTNENKGIYSSWSSTIWDFGTSSEYPKLKWQT